MLPFKLMSAFPTLNFTRPYCNHIYSVFKLSSARNEVFEKCCSQLSEKVFLTIAFIIYAFNSACDSSLRIFRSSRSGLNLLLKSLNSNTEASPNSDALSNKVSNIKPLISLPEKPSLMSDKSSNCYIERRCFIGSLGITTDVPISTSFLKSP